MTRLTFSTLFVPLFCLPVFAGAAELTTAKDRQVTELHSLFKKKGSLQPDATALSGASNRWKVELEIVTLPGKDDLNKEWEATVEKEQYTCLELLRERYQDEFPQVKHLVDRAVKKYAKDQEFTLTIEQGVNHSEITKWLIGEVVSSKVLAKAGSLIQGKGLEFERVHTHDTNAEILGNDTLLIRGDKRVLIVRIEYSHE